MAKRALTTVIAGQYGSYLAEFSLEKEYVYVDPSVRNLRFFPHHGDLTDSLRITTLLCRIHPTDNPTSVAAA